MAQARLSSTDAVGDMAAAVDAFRTQAAAALEDLDMELRRALDWIHHDRHDHWDHEVRRGWERVTQTRTELHQAKVARKIGNHDPACVDEKKALARSKQRLDIALEKVEAVRHWMRNIDQAVHEYRGSRTALAAWLDSEAPKAMSTLMRMIENLESYLAVQVRGSDAAGLPSTAPSSATPQTSAATSEASSTSSQGEPAP